MRKSHPLYLWLFLAIFIIPLRPYWIAAAEPTGGIGVIVEYLADKKIHRVRAVFQGTQAARAKIQPGEEIVSIDGNSTASMSFADVGKKIQGNPGEVVTLVLRSPGSTTTREVRLTRVSQQTVSPLILNAPGSTTGSSYGKPSSPRLSESERNQVKDVILRLKTTEDQQRMQQLLLDFRDGKVTKEDFFKKLKSDFPATP